MPMVRFTSSPPTGIPIEGAVYFAGQVADLSPLWCAVLVQAGQAERYEPPPRERVAVPDVEDRDSFRTVTRKRNR